MKNQCVSFKRGPSGARRCARFANTARTRRGPPEADIDPDEIADSPDTAMHRGGFAGILDNSFKGSDVAMGAGAGLLGTLGVKWVVNKYLLDKVPAGLVKFLPVAGAGATAAVLYFGMKDKRRATAFAVGAVGAGIAVNGWDLVKAQFPALSDMVSLQVPGYGYIAQDGGRALPAGNGYNGLNAVVIDTGNPSMDGLAMSAMGEPDNDFVAYGY